MVIDKKEHQAILAELVKQASFPGHMVEIVCELKAAIAEARIAQEAGDPAHA